SGLAREGLHSSPNSRKLNESMYQSLFRVSLTCTGQVSRLGGLNRETTMYMPDIHPSITGAACGMGGR
ncbi:MAG: hypothetical protein ACLGJA_24955, partial [Gammaproteobacteria bacterium]